MTRRRASTGSKDASKKKLRQPWIGPRQPWRPGLVEEAHTEGKIFVCTGGPGTGKTTVALACVRHASEEGGKVLFVYPTNRQASRMRAQLPPEVEVNTYHAGFGLDEEPGNVAICLARYSLIVVDEI